MSYTDEAKRRIEGLHKFEAEIGDADLRDDAMFQKLFAEARAYLEMSDQEIADALSMSRPSVNRWANGRNLPHHAMRKYIFRWIAEQLAAKAKKLEGNVKRLAASYSEALQAVPVAAKSYR